jgi:hypothetical protein
MANAVFYLMEPTSIAYTGTSATISANGSVSFTACSSLSLNGVFTADYDNYLVVARNKRSSGTNYFTYRLRDSGVDESSASNYYTSQRLLGYGTVVQGFRVNENYGRGSDYSSIESGRVVYLYGPYLSQPTAVRDVSVSGELGATLDNFASTHSLSNAYDGITFFDGAANATGRVAVYGMRK